MTLQEARKFALSLPEATEEPHFDFTSFRVGGKIFASAPPESEYLHVFVPEEFREAALARGSDFLEELHWGKRVVGLRVILPAAKAVEVHALLEQAWSHKAPKRLRALREAKE
ncbi:MmcQ/YjbR family DNA-binding protein [Luteolibacter soli]|uniref:MmcQ/YjbR family DNA-binding protein n=1 Tax=Luteolibacter soli TaxID=3135280 RepID=A0ABU9AUY8_9BACT